MKKDLILPVKGIYFDQIASGEKVREFRLRNDFWTRRLVGKDFGKVVITRGYPRTDDQSRRIVRPWKGYEEQDILHPHFGPEPVSVYAIILD